MDRLADIFQKGGPFFIVNTYFLAVVIALNAGISASFWTGVACYALAALAFRTALARAGTLPAGG